MDVYLEEIVVFNERIINIKTKIPYLIYWLKYINTIFLSIWKREREKKKRVILRIAIVNEFIALLLVLLIGT